MQEIEEYYNAKYEGDSYVPYFNAAPSIELPVILNEDPTIIHLMKWGMEPVWMKKLGKSLINVRAESIKEKPLYKKYIEERRCIIPATGYFEWKKVGTKKVPYRFEAKHKEILSFAGVWNEEKAEDGTSIRTFSIITTEANELAAEVHNRMPVILNFLDEEKWLSEIDGATAISLLKPPSKDYLKMFEVSARINNPKNNDQELINSK